MTEEEKAKTSKHKPIVVNGIYLKHEHDDNFLFRKTKSITIRASVLEQVERVHINL